MKKGNVLSALVFLGALCGAAVPAAAQERLIEVTVVPGDQWSHVKWFGPARITLTPQIALWLEDENGAYAGDLFVTEKSAKSAWGKARRPEALPVWSHARGVRYADGLYMPTADAPLSDAVSGATPKADRRRSPLTITAALPAALPAGRIRVLMEVNNSFDYNDSYREKLNQGDSRYNGVNGQPSTVYAAWLDLSAGAKALPFEFLGSGHPSGADGTLRKGSDGLTTALRIVEKASLRLP